MDLEETCSSRSHFCVLSTKH